jgi:hypothetical protein
MANSYQTFGIASYMTAYTTACAPLGTSPRRLNFLRLALRYAEYLALNDKDAEVFDTKIRDTEELTLAMRLMSRRGWRDVLVAYWELSELGEVEGVGEGVLAGLQGEGNGKGKRRGGEEGEGERKRVRGE